MDFHNYNLRMKLQHAPRKLLGTATAEAEIAFGNQGYWLSGLDSGEEVALCRLKQGKPIHQMMEYYL